MEFLLFVPGAALLVLTGALISGGLRLPCIGRGRKEGREMPPEDEFGRDLAALLAYQAAEAARETEEGDA